MKTTAIKKATPKKAINKPNKTKKTATQTTAVLKPINVLCRQIETSQRNLASLLKTTRLKIEKALQINKTKLAKLIAQEKKYQTTLKTCQVNYKTKPNKLTQAALTKAEQQQRKVVRAREQTQAEQTALRAQFNHYQVLANGSTSQKIATSTAAKRTTNKSSTASVSSTTTTAGIHKTKSPVPSKKAAPPINWQLTPTEKPLKGQGSAKKATNKETAPSLATKIPVSADTEETSNQPDSQCVS